jgi:hypothetical protein
MKLSSLGGAAALLAICHTSALAQPAPGASPILATAPSAVVAPIAPPAGNAMLRVGTQIPFRLLQELTTKGKHLRVGDRVRLETSEAVLINGVTVIPPGTPAVGEITEVRNKGMWGKSGKFTARFLYLTVNGRQIRLSGGFDDKGKSGGVGAAAVSALVFLPAGFFMTGTSALLPAGTVVTGFIDEDVPLALPAQALQVTPLVVTPPPVVEPVVAPVAEPAPAPAQPAAAAEQPATAGSVG